MRLQGEHQGHLQKLIDETTNSMSRMEEEYKSQADNMVHTYSADVLTNILTDVLSDILTDVLTDILTYILTD